MRHIPDDLINDTPPRYGLYDSTICGSISTPLTVNSTNIPVRKAQKYANSLKIQHFDRLYTIKSQSICHGLLGKSGVRIIVADHNWKETMHLLSAGDSGGPSFGSGCGYLYGLTRVDYGFRSPVAGCDVDPLQFQFAPVSYTHLTLPTSDLV